MNCNDTLRSRYRGYLLPVENKSGCQAHPAALIREWWLREDLPVNIIQLECPVQFVLHLPSRGDAQSADKFLKVDGARLVRIKDVEDIVCEGCGVAEGKELLVYFLELNLCEHAAGAILEEACRKVLLALKGRNLGEDSPLYHC
jgi:hypothetical protein